VSSKKLGAGVFNIGGNWSPTLIEVAHLIQERCEKGIGYRPELICSSPVVDSDEEYSLEYQTLAVARTGYRPEGRRIEEVDNLLYFCKVNQNRL
jgi:UDP-glucose 4-epimerase